LFLLNGLKVTLFDFSKIKETQTTRKTEVTPDFWAYTGRIWFWKLRQKKKKKTWLLGSTWSIDFIRIHMY